MGFDLLTRGQATVHKQNLTGHEIRSRREEEECSSHQILRIAHPGQGHASHQTIKKSGITDHILDQRRADKRWSHRVHTRMPPPAHSVASCFTSGFNPPLLAQ